MSTSALETSLNALPLTLLIKLVRYDSPWRIIFCALFLSERLIHRDEPSRVANADIL